MPVPKRLIEVGAQSAVGITLEGGDRLFVVDTYGSQVADIAFYRRDDLRDGFSPGRTMDYNEKVVPVCGDVLYSHRGTPLLRVVEDTVGVHDLLLTPCSAAMFERRGEFAHPSCHENLTNALAGYGLTGDDVTATLNLFMRVELRENRLKVLPPGGVPGDYIVLEAETACVVGISACSSELTNGGSCKAVAFAIERLSQV